MLPELPSPGPLLRPRLHAHLVLGPPPVPRPHVRVPELVRLHFRPNSLESDANRDVVALYLASVHHRDAQAASFRVGVRIQHRRRVKIAGEALYAGYPLRQCLPGKPWRRNGEIDGDAVAHVAREEVQGPVDGLSEKSRRAAWVSLCTLAPAARERAHLVISGEMTFTLCAMHAMSTTSACRTKTFSHDAMASASAKL